MDRLIQQLGAEFLPAGGAVRDVAGSPRSPGPRSLDLERLDRRPL